MSKRQHGRRPPQARTTDRGVAGTGDPGRTVADALTQILAGREPPARFGPLPADGQALAERAGPVIARLLPGLGHGSVKTLLGCLSTGYGILGVGDDTVPAWLLDRSQPVDIFDVMLLGATWPGRFRNVVEFANARDAWLRALERHGRASDLAHLVAVTLDVSDELGLPIDDALTWLGTIIRADQARIGLRPLASALLPARQLSGHRAIYGPPPLAREPRMPSGAVDRVRAFIAFLPDVTGSTAGVPETAGDALRHGVAVLSAAILDDVVNPASLELAMAPMHATDSSGDAGPLAGDPETVHDADACEAEANETLGSIGDPAAIVRSAGEVQLRSAIDAMPPLLLLGALRVGLTGGQPRGRALREAVPWALGLPETSPLVPVTDLLIGLTVRQAAEGPASGVGGLDTLGLVLSLPEADRPIPPDHARWCGATGTVVAGLAMAAGVREVRFEEHRLMALDRTTAQLLRTQAEAFERRFGRPPRPDEPLFFDPDQDEPTPLTLETYGAHAQEALASQGASPLLVRAADLAQMDPPVNGRFPDPSMQREWDTAVAAAGKDLGLSPRQAADQAREDLDRHAVTTTVQILRTAAADETLGTALLKDLRQAISAIDDPDEDLDPVRHGTGPGNAAIGNTLRNHPELTAYAAERLTTLQPATGLARIWADTALADEVRRLYQALREGRYGPVHGEAGDGQHPRISWDLIPAAACIVATATRQQ